MLNRLVLVPVLAIVTIPATAAQARVAAGLLTPSSSARPVDVAQAYLATQPDVLGTASPALRTVRVATGKDGAVVRFQQTFAGLDVVGGTVAVRVDAAGRVRWVSSGVVDVPADLPTTPKLSAAQAYALVSLSRGQFAKPGDATNHAKLVVYAARARTPRLAWMVLLPRDLLRLETLRAYVDADTGVVLWRENLARTDRQAEVFVDNPVVANNVTTPVTLDLPDSPATLTGPDIVAKNCIDRHNCATLGGLTVHMCDFESTAVSNGTFDFPYTRPPLDTTPEDPFSEVQMYYHTTRAYQRFRALDPGFTNLDARPMTALVNLRIPPLDFSGLCIGTTMNLGSLNPFDNAAFMPAGTLLGFPPDDWMVFGQGTSADFAYDGDVVYHEFTHAVMFTVSELGQAVPDAVGLDTTPGGMHEGYADFFSSTITTDAEVGEYAGRGLSAEPLPSGAIRSLDNTKTCPADLTGESHADSEPWSATLWEIRKGLDSTQQAAFDMAMFRVVEGLGANDTFDSVQALILAEISATTELGSTVHDAAQTIIQARGVDGCNGRIIEVADLPSGGKELLFLYGTDQIGEVGTVPGPVQFLMVLPEAAGSIGVTIDRSQSAGVPSLTGPAPMPEISILVKPAASIVWDWSGTTTVNDSTAQGTVTIATDGSATGSATGSFPAGMYYVQLGNSGASAFLGGVRFSSTAAPMPDAGPIGPPDAGIGADGDGGCGCRTGGTGSGTAPLAMLILAGLSALSLRAASRRAGSRRDP